MLFAMSRRGLLNQKMNYVHPRNQTPSKAVVAVGIATVLAMLLGEAGLLLFRGVEPQRRWRTYAALLLDVAARCGVQRIVSLGAVLEAVPQAARGLVEEALGSGVDIRPSTLAFGVFGGPVVAAHAPEGLLRVRPRQVVFATGAVEQVPVFPNNDLPGVMTGQAVQRLLTLYRVAPGTEAVVLACGPEGFQVAAALVAGGTRVILLDSTNSGIEPAASIRVLRGRSVLRALGRRRVTGIEIDPPDAELGGRLRCDLLVVAGILAPAVGLVAQAGAGLVYHRERECLVPVEAPPGVLVAGAVSGARSLEACVAEGRTAGREAAEALGHAAAGEPPFLLLPREGGGDAVPDATLPAARMDGEGKQFACVCMDVTDKELKQAIAEGFDSLELLKRYTTISMGPCQGRSCAWASTRLCADLLGRSLTQTGTTTARPPLAPVPLGVLAADHAVPRKEKPFTTGSR